MSDSDNSTEKKIDTWYLRFMGGALMLALVSLLAVWLHAAVKSDGAVDYCWVAAHTDTGIPRAGYALMGHRPWRTDPRLGMFDTFEAAVAAADQIGCPIAGGKR